MSKTRTINAEFLQDGSGKKYFEFYGKSTYEKPVHGRIATGSYFFEVDTSDVYFYDEETSAWIKAGGGE